MWLFFRVRCPLWLQCMGTLLVNEHMETYLFAPDHFLKPGGKMLPVRGGWWGLGWAVVWQG